MTDLTPDDHALLALAREGHQPEDADRVRTRLALVERLGVGAGLLGASATTSLTRGGPWSEGVRAALSRVLAAKGAALLSCLGLAVVGATSMGLLAAPRPLSRVEAPPSDGRGRLPPPPVPTPSGEAISVEESPPTITLLEFPAEAPMAATRPTHSRTAPRAVAETPLAAPSLEAEMRLVQEGVSALRRGEPGEALARFDEHAHAYPDGVLAEERSAERVMALCAMGRTEDARRAAKIFLSSHASSPLTRLVESSCTSRPIP